MGRARIEAKPKRPGEDEGHDQKPREGQQKGQKKGRQGIASRLVGDHNAGAEGGRYAAHRQESERQGLARAHGRGDGQPRQRAEQKVDDESRRSRGQPSGARTPGRRLKSKSIHEKHQGDQPRRHRLTRPSLLIQPGAGCGEGHSTPDGPHQQEGENGRSTLTVHVVVTWGSLPGHGRPTGERPTRRPAAVPSRRGIGPPDSGGREARYWRRGC